MSLTALMIAVVSLNKKTAKAVRKLVKRITRGKVIRMLSRVARPWWAPAYVVGLHVLATPAGSC